MVDTLVQLWYGKSRRIVRLPQQRYELLKDLLETLVLDISIILLIMV
ncbi:MAG: hypothetical protein VXW41_08845 [SAR324 cluster bacterium]|nr:hypothetical protein [SAR324 cluster bacterium]